MPDKQTEKHSPQGSDTNRFVGASLPKCYEHRASMKWMTIESLRVVLERLDNRTMGRVLFLTSIGVVEGELTEIAPSYSESFELEGEDSFVPELTSMVANLRIDLLRLAEQSDQQLELVDTAPLIGLKRVTIRTSGQIIELPELTLFADQISGFAISKLTVH
jgi:hypothetical protein